MIRRIIAVLLGKRKNDKPCTPQYNSLSNAHFSPYSVLRITLDETFRSTKEKFFEGEGPSLDRPRGFRVEKRTTTAEERMRRIEPRLRRVVLKAWENSYPATKVLIACEDFLLPIFSPESVTSCTPDNNWWVGLLEKEPWVRSTQEEKSVSVEFRFNSSSTSGGFHRLILHAVAQFHGLEAKATSARQSGSKCLEISGLKLNGDVPLLSKHLQSLC